MLLLWSQNLRMIHSHSFTELQMLLYSNRPWSIIPEPFTFIIAHWGSSTVRAVRSNCYFGAASPQGVYPTWTLLSFESPEPDPLLCLLPREMAAVYRDGSVLWCPGIWSQSLRWKETEGRYHEKELVQRCNWDLSFFRKHFILRTSKWVRTQRAI